MFVISNTSGTKYKSYSKVFFYVSSFGASKAVGKPNELNNGPSFLSFHGSSLYP